LPFDGTPRRTRQRVRHDWIAGIVVRGAAVLVVLGGLLLLAGLGRIT